MKEGKTITEDYLMKNWDGTTNTSWVDAIYGKGKMQKHNLGFTGGNQMVTIISRLLILTMTVW